MTDKAVELADFLEKNMVASVAILGDVTATHIVATLRQQTEELIDAGGMISMLREKVSQQTKRIEELEAKLQIHDAMDSRCKELMKQVKGLIK